MSRICLLVALVVALTGCVENRDRTHAKCILDAGWYYGEHSKTPYLNSCMRAAGYQMGCSRDEDAVIVSLLVGLHKCWEPMGSVDRVFFYADALRRGGA